MDQFPVGIFWLLVAALPVGLAAAGYWAKGYFFGRTDSVVPPGEPGNPTDKPDAGVG